MNYIHFLRRKISSKKPIVFKLSKPGLYECGQRKSIFFDRLHVFAQFHPAFTEIAHFLNNSACYERQRPCSSQFEINQTLKAVANNHYEHSKIRPYLTNSVN